MIYKCNILTEHDELNVRDDRVVNVLRAKIEDLTHSQRELNEQVLFLRHEQTRILNAIKKEEWWALAGILTKDEIESLCSISPTYLYNEICNLET